MVKIIFFEKSVIIYIRGVVWQNIRKGILLKEL